MLEPVGILIRPANEMGGYNDVDHVWPISPPQSCDIAGATFVARREDEPGYPHFRFEHGAVMFDVHRWSPDQVVCAGREWTWTLMSAGDCMLVLGCGDARTFGNALRGGARAAATLMGEQAKRLQNERAAWLGFARAAEPESIVQGMGIAETKTQSSGVQGDDKTPDT